MLIYQKVLKLKLSLSTAEKAEKVVSKLVERHAIAQKVGGTYEELELDWLAGISRSGQVMGFNRGGPGINRLGLQRRRVRGSERPRYHGL